MTTVTWFITHPIVVNAVNKMYIQEMTIDEPKGYKLVILL